MLKTIQNAFKIKDIRSRIFYTFIILIVVRLGSQLPLPGADADVIKQILGNFSEGAFSFFDALTGSSFSNMSIFALKHISLLKSGLSPHISRHQSLCNFLQLQFQS